MKFSKKLKCLLFFICSIILLLSTICYADNSLEDGIMLLNDDTTSTETTTQLTNTEKNAKDLFLLDDSVTVDYSVTGNVFILANNVTISSRIVGNVFILAQNVNITSKAYINSSLFVCADTVTIDGDIFDLYSISSALSLSSNGRILRDISASGDILDLYGSIVRNANFSFDTINIDNNSVSIGGDLYYTSSTASISEELVGGEFSFSEFSQTEQTSNTTNENLNNLLKTTVVSIIIILIIVFALPKFAEKEQNILENKALASIGYGAIALISIPIICFILFCTVIGILPAISILLAYIFVIANMVSALVSVPVAKIICNKINKNTKGMNILLSIILVVTIWLLKLIPILGSFISLLVVILGLGLLVYPVFYKKVEKNIVAKDK